jgi:hypothetical protein
MNNCAQYQRLLQNCVVSARMLRMYLPIVRVTVQVHSTTTVSGTVIPIQSTYCSIHLADYPPQQRNRWQPCGPVWMDSATSIPTLNCVIVFFTCSLLLSALPTTQFVAKCQWVMHSATWSPVTAHFSSSKKQVSLQKPWCYNTKFGTQATNAVSSTANPLHTIASPYTCPGYNGRYKH